MGPEFEIYESEKDSQHYWRLQAANGEIIAQSEGYSSELAAARGVEAVTRGVLESLGINVGERIMVSKLSTVPDGDGLKLKADDVPTTYLAVDGEKVGKLPLPRSS